MSIHIIYIVMLFLILLTGCHDNNSHPHEMDELIKRFDQEIYAYPDISTDKRKFFSEKYHDVITILPYMESDNDSSILNYALSRGVRQFTPDITARFTMQDSIDDILYQFTENIQESLPAIKKRTVYGIVSTFNQSIILNDSTLLLGLNHYLGSDYPGYEYFDLYQRRNKTPEHLPYDYAEAVIKSDFGYTSSHPDLLSRMLYEGAVLYIIDRLMPDSKENELMGYNPSDLEWLKQHEKSLWDGLVSKRLIYSTDPLVATRLISPAPHSNILNPESPGRAARYLGYKIIKSYMKQNKDTPLDSLLSPEFYNNFSTLMDSRYRP